jgi:oligopeptide transport system substrate-binding protein
MPRPSSILARGAALAFLGLGLVSCGRSPAPTPAPAAEPAKAVEDRVLRRSAGAEIDSLDPPMAALVESGNVLRDMYEGLVRVGPDLRPIPGVAERWDVSADGLEYTFHLRSNARWSNGDPVTSGDFVTSWRRLVDPKTGASQANALQAVVNAVEVVRGTQPVESLDISAPDDRTLVVKLVAPSPFFPLATAHWSLLPTHRGQPPGGEASVVSNGAFKLSRRTVGSDLELRRNPNYWNDASTRLEAVRYFEIADSNLEYTRYRAGELDVTNNLPMTTLDQLRAEHGNALRVTPSLAIYYYGFNVSKPPFTSRDVRQALAMTVDREKLVERVTVMGETPAYAWVPVGMPNHTPQTPSWAVLPHAERVAQARALALKAGFSASRPLRFELRYNTGTGHEKIAIAVAAMWKEALGADVRLVAEEFKALLQTIQRGDAQMFRSSWSADVPDAYAFVNVFSKNHEFNFTGYSNPMLDELMSKAFRTADPAERRSMIESAERLVIDDAVVVPLYYMVNRKLVAPRVVDWTDNPLRVVYSQNVSVKN